jgi:hypothetical protein
MPDGRRGLARALAGALRLIFLDWMMPDQVRRARSFRNNA